MCRVLLKICCTRLNYYWNIDNEYYVNSLTVSLKHRGIYPQKKKPLYQNQALCKGFLGGVWISSTNSPLAECTQQIVDSRERSVNS